MKIEPTIDIKQLLVGDLNRLRYIRRYSTSLVLHSENVAEHSYYVTLYALYVTAWVNNQKVTEFKGKPVVDLEKVLIRAIIHDTDESISGDFQRPFKYSSKKLTEMLKEAAQILIEKVFVSLTNMHNFNYFLSLQWHTDKDDTLEGKIIDFCDYLAVVSYLAMESRSVSQSMAAHFETMQAHIDHFRSSDFDFLRPLILQTEVLVEEILKKAKA